MTRRDQPIGPDGLTRRDRDLIREVLARYPDVRRVTLFGSRAMGTFGRGSDIDLALEGPDLDTRTLTRIATELEDSDLPYKVDLLLRDDQLEPKLEAHIQRHGKLFGWEVTTLGDVIELKRGYDLPARDRREGNFPIISSSGYSGTHDKAKIRAPGVVTGRYGTIGDVFYVNEDFWPLNTTLYVRDFKGNDPLFISYFLRSVDFQSFNDKSSVPGLNRNDLHRSEVVIPLLSEQRAIAAVLGSLDDKIEQNRRTARALERLARAIFRAWFVDFAPVKAKAAGATAFPSMPQPVFDALPTRFVDSAIGPVPEGWGVKAIASIATFLNGLALQKYPPRGDGNDLRVIKIAQLRKGSTEGADWANADVPDQYVVEDRDLLFSWSGTLEAELWFGGKGALNQHLFKVTSSHFPQWFCLLWIRQHLPWFRAIASSKATTMGHIQRGHLQEAKVAVPPDEVLCEAHGVIGSIYDLFAQIMIESRKLAVMRDYLLPKLLSGNVRVKHAERYLETTA